MPATLTDPMVNVGEMCASCDVVFIKPHGHPVLCTRCDAGERRDHRTRRATAPRARHPEMRDL